MIFSRLAAGAGNGGGSGDIIDMTWLTDNATKAFTLGCLVAAIGVVWGIKHQRLGAVIGVLACVAVAAAIGFAPWDTIGPALGRHING